MRQDEFNNWQNPYNKPEQKKPEIKGWDNPSIVVTGLCIASVALFGLLGSLICYGGYWAVRAIARSNLPSGLRTALCVLATLGFVALVAAAVVLGTVLQNAL